MLKLTRRMALASAAALTIAGTAGAQAQTKPMRIAFGDIPSVESLYFLIAVERTKEKGVPVEMAFVKSEDIAAQAVLGGQADVGVGTPYAMLQKVRAPLKLFYQMNTLKFFPVVNTDAYKTWKDLDGQEVTVNSRGSGTEAIMKLAADKNKIKFKNISYVPGSEVRLGALLQGTVKASILDSTNHKLLMERGGGKFAVLPLEDVSATDDALFANADFLKNNAKAVDTLVESLLTTIREISAKPEAAAELRTKYKLLPDLPKQLEADIVRYYKEASASKSMSPTGGTVEAAKNDLTFFNLAGQITGDPATLKVEDFWDFGPLDRAKAKLKM
ncbi:MAG TPA: ABC transporter substrate-binding protein [Beijerinckiaceae bacterium]|jgi:NitT/TauT family transport system substrate-binding protein